MTSIIVRWVESVVVPIKPVATWGVLMKIVALTSGSANSKGKVKVTLRLAKEIFIPQVKPKGAVFLALNVPPPEASGL